MGRAFVQQIMDKYRRLDEIWVIARHLQKEMWQERFGTKIVLLPLDLLQEAQQKRLRCRLFAEDVRVKILVNAAGMGRIGTFEEITLPEHQQTTRLNDEALMTVTYLCLPYMEKGSHIIQMASASAFVPQPGFAVYAASKAYVLSFSRALRSEVRKKGITVTCVCPDRWTRLFLKEPRNTIKCRCLRKNLWQIQSLSWKRPFMMRPAGGHCPFTDGR